MGEKRSVQRLYTDVFSPSIINSSSNNGLYEEIEILVLDEVLKTNNITNIDFIKIDVEGYEMNVLKGSQKILSGKNAPVMCVEYIKKFQDANYNEASIYNFIKSINDYKIYQLEKSSNTVSKLIEITYENTLRDCDNMYCFTSSHIQKFTAKGIFK